MSWWHNPDGSPAKPFEGTFDPSHLMPVLMVLIVIAVILARHLLKP